MFKAILLCILCVSVSVSQSKKINEVDVNELKDYLNRYLIKDLDSSQSDENDLASFDLDSNQDDEMKKNKRFFRYPTGGKKKPHSIIRLG